MAGTGTGEKKANWFKRHKILTGLIALFVIIAATSGASGDKGNSNTTPKQQSTPAQNNQSVQPSKSDDSIKEGTYKVGTDLAAGEYRLIGSGYMQVSTDSTGSIDSIVTNDNFQNNTIVTVAEGQYFKFSGAKAYPIDKAPSVDTSKAGVFRVGKDLPAGEYKLTPEGGSGYVQVSSDSKGAMTSIVSNENFSADTYITVSDGQYLTVKRAHIVK